MKVRAFITHKKSEHYSDCQDRFCINRGMRTVAVSDGMSQSIFSDYWADILSRFYAENGHCTNDDRISLCDKWMERVHAFFDKEKSSGKNPWRLENNIAESRGAGATICGIKFDNDRDWSCQVLGDSCVFLVGLQNGSVYSWAHITSEKRPFDNYPDYYDSFPNKEGRGTIVEEDGSIDESNLIILVSDPFSEFLYNHSQESKELIEQILCLKSHEDYCNLVKEWRAKGLHNDDSTLCIIEYDGESTMNVIHEDNIDLLIEEESKAEPLTNEDSEESSVIVNDESYASNEICENQVQVKEIQAPEETISFEEGTNCVNVDVDVFFQNLLKSQKTEVVEKMKKKSKDNKLSVEKAKNIVFYSFDFIKEQMHPFICKITH